MLLMSLAIWANFQPARADMQFDHRAVWFNAPLPVQYHVGVDGINLSLTILTTFIVLMAVLASNTITTRPKLYSIALSCFLPCLY